MSDCYCGDPACARARAMKGTMDAKTLEFLFIAQPPTKEEREIYAQINEAYLFLAQLIEPLLPEGQLKDDALLALADARIAANRCVSLRGRL